MYIDYIYGKTYALMWDNYKMKYMGLDGRKSVLGLDKTRTWTNLRIIMVKYTYALLTIMISHMHSLNFRIAWY